VILGAASPAFADLNVTYTSVTRNGQFAPRNVVSAWIETPAGAFVKTADRKSGVRTIHLVAWGTKAGAGDADAVTGATRLDHATPVTFTWNLRDRTGKVVADGMYTLRLEMAEDNSTTAGQNNQGTFTFVVGPTAQMQTGLANGGFTNVSIDFQPVNTRCGNGVVDGGEACDPSVLGSCPTQCAEREDACMPAVVVGDALSCTATCMVVPITSCISNDGCCAAGCDASNDSDCGGNDGDDGLSGGCATSTGETGALAVLAGLALIGVARRRRHVG
jgi:MYXO-CTERM domain-containing protein